MECRAERDSLLSCCGASVSFQDLFFGDGNVGGVTIIDVALVFVVDGDIIFIGHFTCAQKSVVLDPGYNRHLSGCSAEFVM